MKKSLEKELDELIDEVAPALIDTEQLFDMAQLERLVSQEEAAELFDGECLVHDSCRNVVWRFPERVQ